MATVQFDRDSLAGRYARQHLNIDPGITEVWYLPKGAGDREIRLIEVNKLMYERTDDYEPEPIDFGVDRGMKSHHQLVVLDVTPDQWKRIQKHTLPLPRGWSLEDARQLP